MAVQLVIPGLEYGCGVDFSNLLFTIMHEDKEILALPSQNEVSLPFMREGLYHLLFYTRDKGVKEISISFDDESITGIYELENYLDLPIKGEMNLVDKILSIEFSKGACGRELVKFEWNMLLMGHPYPCNDIESKYNGLETQDDDHLRYDD